jgi:hypothetical protein
MTELSLIICETYTRPAQCMRSLRAFLCVLLLAGCGDGSAPDEAPHGPPGGLIDVNNDSIPLGEDSAAGGRAGAGGGGASHSGVAGKAGSTAQGGASGHLPPAKGVSSPCETSDDCGAGLTCHLSPDDYIAHKQCSKYCATEEECTDSLGADSFCIGGHICVHTCKSDADCLARTHCNSNGWCERSGPGSGVPYCTGSATPCSLLSDLTCISARGCIDDSRCSGVSTSCYSQYDSYSCTNQDGCYWSSSSKSCSGSAHSCTGYSGKFSCGNQEGCHWTGGCTGIPNSCASQYPSLCDTQPGCYLATD